MKFIPCSSTTHCAAFGWCHRCHPKLAQLMEGVNLAIQRGETDGARYDGVGRHLLAAWNWEGFHAELGTESNRGEENGT